MEFAKWEALGNDYVLIDRSATGFRPDPERVREICDRHRGVGADGIVLIEEPDGDDAVASLRIFNADGSEAEISGNGVRQAVLYLHAAGRTPGNRFAVRTPAGLRDAEVTGPGAAKVEMGTAATASPQYPEGGADGLGSLAAGGELWAFRHVSVGNPQCTIRASGNEELSGLDIDEAGPAIENAPAFPERTNVSWWTEVGEGRIRARLFERGVGETSASGTGACGAAVDYVLRGGRSPVVVEMDGGTLEVTVDEGLNVSLAGTAREVYRGELPEEPA